MDAKTNTEESQNAEKLFSDAPPCVRELVSGRAEITERAVAVKQLGVFLHKSGCQDVVGAIVSVPHVRGPLKSADIGKLVRGRRKNYLCKERQCEKHCNPTACGKLQHGVDDPMEGWDFSKVVKFTEADRMGRQTGAPPVYRITINGQEITFTRPELTSNKHFREKLFEYFDAMPKAVDAPRWEDWLAELLTSAERVLLPYELTPLGELEGLLRDFLREAAEGDHARDLAAGAVLFDTREQAWLFRLGDFRGWLRTRRASIGHGAALDGQLAGIGIQRTTRTFRNSDGPGNTFVRCLALPADVVPRSDMPEPETLAL